MSIKISGRLIDGLGSPIVNCKITLKALRTSATVIAHTIASQNPDEAGLYDMAVEPGHYRVTLGVSGYQPEYVGDIQIYHDSPSGTLNYFLGLPNESDLRPGVMKAFEDMAAKVSAQASEVEKNKADTDASAAAAKDSETTASASAAAAKDSEATASASAAAAKDSEATASASAAAAKDSETAASASATAAKGSETATSASAAAAKDSETAASTSATAAKSSETAASASATDAKDSAAEANASAWMALSASQKLEGKVRDAAIDVIRNLLAFRPHQGLSENITYDDLPTPTVNVPVGTAILAFVFPNDDGNSAAAIAEQVPGSSLCLIGLGVEILPHNSPSWNNPHDWVVKLLPQLVAGRYDLIGQPRLVGTYRRLGMTAWKSDKSHWTGVGLFERTL